MLHCRTHPTTSWERLNSWDSGGVFGGPPGLSVSHSVSPSTRSPYRSSVQPLPVTWKRMHMAAASSHMQVQGGPWATPGPGAWGLGPASQRASEPAHAQLGSECLIRHIKSGTTNLCPCALCNENRRRLHMGDPWDHHRRRNITDGPRLSQGLFTACPPFLSLVAHAPPQTAAVRLAFLVVRILSRTVSHS